MVQRASGVPIAASSPWNSNGARAGDADERRYPRRAGDAEVVTIGSVVRANAED